MFLHRAACGPQCAERARQRRVPEPGALELLSATAAASAAGRLRHVLVFHVLGTVVLSLRDVGVGMRHDARETL